MSLADAGARGSFVTLGSQGIALLARMVGVIVLARLLAPEVFGLVAVVTSITVFVTAIIFLGLPMATAQATHLSHRASSSLFVINAVLGAIVAAALYACAQPLAALYAAPELVQIVQWLALVPLMTGLTAQFRQQLIRNLRFGALALTEVISQVGGILIAILVALAGGTYEAIVAQSVATAALALVGSIAWARWFPWRTGMWRDEVLPIVRVGTHIFGMNLARNASRSVIVPVLGLAATPAAVGQYDRAQQLTLQPINLTVDQLQRVVVPILSRLRNDRARMLSYMQRFQLVGAYCTSSAFLVLAAIAVPLTTMLLGEDWALAGTVMQFLAIGAVFRVAGQSMQWLFISAEATAKGLRFNLWSQPAIALISLAGLPWGVVGVAAASAIAWAAYWPASVFWAARAAGFRAWDLMSSVLRGIFMFAAPVAFGAWLGQSLELASLLRVVVALGVAAVVSIVLGLLIRPVRSDLAVVLRTVRRAARRAPN